MRLFVLLFISIFFSPSELLAGYPKAQQHYWSTVMPIMRKHCNTTCHNADDKKGGLNLNSYDFILTIQRDGEVFSKVIEHVSNGTMPPQEYPRLSKTEKDTLLFYLNKYLDDALSVPDPGIIIARRLSNREYKYVIEDLFDLEVKVDSLFPRDPAGGEGFDNYASTLYLTPLLMERYFDVADQIVERAALRLEEWGKRVPAFRLTTAQKVRHWWYRWWHRKDIRTQTVVASAKSVILPLATLAYRRYLTPQEKEDLMGFFTQVYLSQSDMAEGYQRGIKETFKAILVSPHFLIRQEADPPKTRPYLVSNFELATRLSFFLWNSIPDYELLEVAYRGQLHDEQVLDQQVNRMLQSPKVMRMAESFSTQWLEIEKLKDPTHEIDPVLFPSYDDKLRQAMHEEAVHFFYEVLTKERNLLRLLDGQYTFLNETLAKHYQIGGVHGPEMRKVNLSPGQHRGGVLGMAGILTATSLPNRTSPVLRGKWVMEKILATSAKPPPPNIPELEAAKKVHDETDLRKLLLAHRDSPECIGCHQDMDDLGFALENFDAIGRWRESYPNLSTPIDVSGALKSGEHFQGVSELREVLLEKKAQFAKGLSRKMLGYALGRSIVFKDKKTVETLGTTLLENDFDPLPFIKELVNSYPFRYKKSDPVVVDTDFGEDS